MPGRMSALHNATGLTPGQSLPPVGRNGDTTNTVNGSAVDLHGKRGAYFIVDAGALTNDATYAAYLQTNDLPLDPSNGNWANVNTTTYPNAEVEAKTNANSAFEMSYQPKGGDSPVVRAVLVTDNNVAVVGVTHITF